MGPVRRAPRPFAGKPGARKLFSTPSIFSARSVTCRRPEPLESILPGRVPVRRAALDDWLAVRARRAGSDSARVYVTTLEDGETVVGYYALAAAQVAPAQARRALSSAATHPVPAVLLARLAVDRQHQGAASAARPPGRALRCVRRPTRSARALLVHAKHGAAAVYTIRLRGRRLICSTC